MLNRKAYKDLVDWKNSKNKQALLVVGARQVGKTHLIREFAATNYKHVVEINVLETSNAKESIDKARNSKELFANLTLLSDEEFVPGETLIFLDEVQVAKEIVTAIKFLVQNNDFDFILSGSMLGTELKDIRSVPVGYLDTITMYPLDFAEFASARGIKELHFEQLLECFIKREALPDLLHSRLLSTFYEYLIVGGMPAVVNIFNEENNLQTVRRFQENIILLNKQDISQYNKSDALIIKDIYDLIPSELNAQNKRFILKDMNKKARFSKYQDNFIWLTDAGVAIPVYNVQEPKYPLLLSKCSNLFKLFMGDVGLLTSTFLRDTATSILAKNANINYGSIYENAVAQELTATGFKPYYYKSKKLGEIDFAIETKKGEVLPLEVKSGGTIRRHAALDNVVSVKNYNIKEGFVLSDNNLKRIKNITYLPVYAAGLLSIL